KYIADRFNFSKPDGASKPDKASKPGGAPKPEDIKGKTSEEVGKMMGDRGWGDSEPSQGGGEKWQKPGSKGSDRVRIEKGNPNDPNPVKRGPYGRISEFGNKSEPIPLKGNPTLNQ